MKKFVLSLVLIAAALLVLGSLGYLKKVSFAAMESGHHAMPAQKVTAVAVASELWESSVDTVGSLAPYQGVTVTTESSGIITHIYFEAGTKVKAGDLLFKLDTSVVEAQLAAVEAQNKLTELNVARMRELFGQNSISKSDLDAAEAQFKQAHADAESTRALLRQKEIRAPFDGRLGIRSINVGQFVDRGAPIVSLQALDPIYVNFSVPQQQLTLMGLGYKVRVEVDAIPGHVFEGKLSAVNPDIDAATRNVRVQATLLNADERLRPGMYVRVSVVQPQNEAVNVIPITAVAYASYGDSVFVIEHNAEGELVVNQKFVRLGLKRGDFVVVTSGLKAGDQVVSTGVFKLRNGIAVEIDNTLSPQFSVTPKPENN